MTKCKLKEQDKAEILLGAGLGGGALNPAATAHLASCDSCAEAFAGHAALWARLDNWTVPEVSSSFNRELYARIDAANAEAWYDRWAAHIRALFAQPSLAFATAALVVGAGFALDHSVIDNHSRQATHAGVVKVSTSEAEQVEKTLDDLEMLRQFDLTAEEKETTSKSM